MTALLPLPEVSPAPAPLPPARGPLSTRCSRRCRRAADPRLPGVPGDVDPYGDDLQLALHLAYELHYRPLAGVDADLEWDPDLLRLRRALEQPFLAALRATVAAATTSTRRSRRCCSSRAGTGPSWHLARRGRALAAARVRRAPVGLPPQGGRPAGLGRAAAGGPGQGRAGRGAARRVRRRRAERMHAAPVRRDDARARLDDGYGAHVDAAPATTLAPVNLMSLVGLHRSLRGAAVGQFVMVEVTSSPGSRRLSSAFDRLPTAPRGSGSTTSTSRPTRCTSRCCAPGLRDLLAREPELAADVVLGIEAGLLLEDRFGDRVLGGLGARRELAAPRRSSCLGPHLARGGWCRRTAGGGCAGRCTARRPGGRSARRAVRAAHLDRALDEQRPAGHGGHAASVHAPTLARAVTPRRAAAAAGRTAPCRPVGQHDVVRVGALPDVGPHRPQRLEPGDLGGLVGRPQVEVQPVLLTFSSGTRRNSRSGLTPSSGLPAGGSSTTWSACA